MSHNKERIIIQWNMVKSTMIIGIIYIIRFLSPHKDVYLFVWKKKEGLFVRKIKKTKTFYFIWLKSGIDIFGIISIRRKTFERKKKNKPKIKSINNKSISSYTDIFHTIHTLCRQQRLMLCVLFMPEYPSYSHT